MTEAIPPDLYLSQQENREKCIRISITNIDKVNAEGVVVNIGFPNRGLTDILIDSDGPIKID